MRPVKVRGTRWPLLLGNCFCPLVLAGGVPLWCASWPRVLRCACSGPVALGAAVGLPDAVVPFPNPEGFYSRISLPAENRAHCACGWPLPRQGRWARSAWNQFGAPRWGCPWRVPLASFSGCVRCGGLRVCTRSLMRPVSRTVRHSTGDSVGAPALFRVDANTSSFGSEDATPGSRACLRVLDLLGRVGRAGLLGAVWCASPFLWPFCPSSLPGPLRAGVALFLSFCLPPLPFFFFFFIPLGLLGLVFVSFHPAFPLPPPSSFFFYWPFLSPAPPPCLFCRLPAARPSVCPPFFLCSAFGLLPVVPCVWSCHRALALVVSSCRVVRVLHCCPVWVWAAVCCAVLCCWMRCCAPLRCAVFVLCCVVSLDGGRSLVCCALGHRLLSRCPVLLGAVFCGFPPRCVQCAERKTPLLSFWH